MKQSLLKMYINSVEVDSIPFKSQSLALAEKRALQSELSTDETKQVTFRIIKI